jgi:hypothetical protein
LYVWADTTYARAAIPEEVEDRVTAELGGRIARVIEGAPDGGPFSCGDATGACHFRVSFRALPLAQSPVIGDNESNLVYATEAQEGTVPVREEKAKELFRDLPRDAGEQLEAVAEIYQAVRREAARALRPAIATLLSESAAMDFEAKSALARKINETLKDARLALRDPRTDLPASLVAHRPRPTSPASYLRLQDSRSAADGRRHFLRVRDLDQGGVVLMDASADPDPPPPGRGR